MSKENTKKLISSILSGNKEKISMAFKEVMDHKFIAAKEARKVAIASQIYSKPKSN